MDLKNEKLNLKNKNYMEQTTLQQRINERATKRLLKDLEDATNKEVEIARLINIHRDKPDKYPTKLDARNHFSEYGNPKNQTKIYNEYTQEVFDTLLPKYISIVTDEILQKIDEIDYLLDNKNQFQEQDY